MTNTCTEDEVLASLQVGHRVWFVEEKMPYTVQARSDRYIICTKPFAARRTVIYSIIDTVDRIRGPDNLVFGMGYETQADCEARLVDLMENGVEVSYRRRALLNIAKTAS